MKLHAFWPHCLGIFALSVALRGGQSAPVRYQPLQAPTEKAEIKTAFAAMDYYGNHCGRCHGIEGANYDTQSLKKRDAISLRTVTDEMAKGPGQAPLEAEQLDAVTAWHQAFIAGKPFVSVTEIQREGSKIQLKGEATSDAKIELSCTTTPDAPQVLAPREGTMWSAQLPADTDLSTLQVLATKGDSQTLLKLDGAAYSYAQSNKTESNSTEPK